MDDRKPTKLEAAFAKAMRGKLYGDEESRDAHGWFKAGWEAAEHAANPDYITVTTGMRGIFPVHMTWNSDMNGFWEPVQTGGTCKSYTEAHAYAKEWADAEGIDYRPGVGQR